jgi:hypothetical protein
MTEPATETTAEKTPREKLPALDLTALDEIEVIKTAETMHAMRPQKTRTDEQAAVDDLVRKAYNAWLAAGRPEKWDSKAPHGIKLAVREDQLKSVQAAIRNGGNHFNFRIRMGKVTVTDGRARFAFIATDKPDE